MSKIITPIEAVVEHITDMKEGQYGIYKSVLFKTPDGEKIWKSFPPDSEELSILQVGARVRLIPNGSTRSGKPSHVIELMDSAPAASPKVQNPEHSTESQPQPNPTKSSTVSDIKSAKFADLTDERKREIAAYIEQMGALYRFAYGQAAQHLKGMNESEETVRCAASTLFISAQRRFNL